MIINVNPTAVRSRMELASSSAALYSLKKDIDELLRDQETRVIWDCVTVLKHIHPEAAGKLREYEQRVRDLREEENTK